MIRLVAAFAFLAETAAFSIAPTSLGPNSNHRLTSRRIRASSPAISQLRSRLDAVFFDCDGVLADTERDGHRISFNKAFQEFGLKVGDKDMEWDVETYGKLVEIGGGRRG